MKTIFIVDNNYGDECTQSYKVEVKLTSDSVFVERPVQYTSPVQVDSLEDDTSYDIRITRRCCNGTISTPQTVTILTTKVTDPVNVIATATSATEIDVDWDWDGYGEAHDGYVLERGLNSDYSDAEVIYTAATTSFADTGLTTATTYYYRVRAYADGYLASDFVTVNETTL